MLRAPALWILLIGLASCSRDAPRSTKIDPDAPTRVILATPGGDVSVTVEVASTPTVIKQGLKNRRELPADQGMLFLMKSERVWSFWMKNTLIPLDMIFITRELTVAGVVHRAAPETETPQRVGAMSLYVLEVNGGWAASHGITNGAKVRFENVKLLAP